MKNREAGHRKKAKTCAEFHAMKVKCPDCGEPETIIGACSDGIISKCNKCFNNTLKEIHNDN